LCLSASIVLRNHNSHWIADFSHHKDGGDVVSQAAGYPYTLNFVFEKAILTTLII
jgi:hypothetical protein